MLKKRMPPGGEKWTRQEIAVLRKSYRLVATKAIAYRLGRTIESVRHKASDLGFRKAPPSVRREAAKKRRAAKARNKKCRKRAGVRW